MPWCPKCKSEYVEGVEVCADCGSKLVASLDEAKNKAKEEEAAQKRAYMEHMQEVQQMHEQQAAARAAMENGEESPELMQARERYLASMGRGHRGGSSGVYEDTSKKAEEFKSGAYTLIVVGILGMIALGVLSTDLLPVRLHFPSQWIVYLVMGALFILFFVSGILSLRSGKELEKKAVKEGDDKKELIKFLKERVDLKAIDAKMLDPDGDDTTESRYFKRTSILRAIIKQYFPEMDDTYMEHILDDVYSELFKD